MRIIEEKYDLYHVLNKYVEIDISFDSFYLVHVKTVP